MIKLTKKMRQNTACSLGFVMLFVSGCASQNKDPALAAVATSEAAVTDATASGAMEVAPAEISAAREKLNQANRAMADKNYSLAREFANQAEVDAQLAKSKANSTKAQMLSEVLQNDLRILREELGRANSAAK